MWHFSPPEGAREGVFFSPTSHAWCVHTCVHHPSRGGERVVVGGRGCESGLLIARTHAFNKNHACVCVTYVRTSPLEGWWRVVCMHVCDVRYAPLHAYRHVCSRGDVVHSCVLDERHTSLVCVYTHVHIRVTHASRIPFGNASRCMLSMRVCMRVHTSGMHMHMHECLTSAPAWHHVPPRSTPLRAPPCTRHTHTHTSHPPPLGLDCLRLGILEA